MSRPVSQIRYGNRIIQQKQDTISLQKHYESLRKARPLTGNTVQRNAIQINNKKRQMVQQNRFTQIQRQNRILFHKITSIMHKGTISQAIGPRQPSNSRLNRTLNGGYRRKQMQNIEYENAKMLKRLKQKRSQYQVSGLNRDWQKKKKVIKNMALYPFILNDNMGAQIRRQRIQDSFLDHSNQAALNDTIHFMQSSRELRRIRKINGFMFLISVKFEDNKFFIVGDIKEEQSIKVIELERKQAEDFIMEECNGNIDNLFGLLRFDRESGDLYLVGKNVGEIQDVKDLQLQRKKTFSQHDTRQKRYIQRAAETVHASRQPVKSYYPPRPLSKELSRKNPRGISKQSNNQEEQEYINFNPKNNQQQIDLSVQIAEKMSKKSLRNIVPKQKQPKTEQSMSKKSDWIKAQRKQNDLQANEIKYKQSVQKQLE